jgi:hypothetical protein
MEFANRLHQPASCAPVGLLWQASCLLAASAAQPTAHLSAHCCTPGRLIHVGASTEAAVGLAEFVAKQAENMPPSFDHLNSPINSVDGLLNPGPRSPWAHERRNRGPFHLHPTPKNNSWRCHQGAERHTGHSLPNSYNTCMHGAYTYDSYVFDSVP